MKNQPSYPSTVRVFNDDCLKVLKTLPSESVDSVVTDPPYAMGAARAAVKPHAAGGGQADTKSTYEGGVNSKRAPQASDPAETPPDPMEGAMLGQHSQNWAETATHSRGYIDNDPDRFEDWCLLWAAECLRVLKPGGHLIAFGGTRTWHRLARGIETAGFEIRGSMAWLYATGFAKGVNVGAAMAGSKSIGGSARQTPETVPLSVPDGAAVAGDATDWNGWATALKPGHEPMVLARKPLIGTVARNVTAYGTGAMNIDGCRIVNESSDRSAPPHGRWPSDVFLDASAASLLNDKAGGRPVADFFWHAKPGKNERVSFNGVTHPTVKPLSLMRELVRLVTPPGGTVLDPFAGSGTTVEACAIEGLGCIAIERDPTYIALIQQRIQRQSNAVGAAQHRDPEDRPSTLFD